MRSIRSSIPARRCISSTRRRKAYRESDPAPGGPASNGGAREVGLWPGQTQPDRQTAQNGGSRARLGVNIDRAAMQLYQALDQGEAKPGAGFARLRIAALEFLENPLAI